jgi:predicted kinase
MMPCLTIVSGCPGTGKTTLSARLAATAPTGVHLDSDVFYRFPARRLDPTTAQSHGQNTTIMKALGRAAAAFAEGGYHVFLDGVVGPWFLPVLTLELPSGIEVEYVVLYASLDQVLHRVRVREGPGASARVRHMHRAFSNLGPYAGHRLDTSELSAERVLACFLRRRASGDFVVNLEALAP